MCLDIRARITLQYRMILLLCKYIITPTAKIITTAMPATTYGIRIGRWCSVAISSCLTTAVYEISCYFEAEKLYHFQLGSTQFITITCLLACNAFCHENHLLRFFNRTKYAPSWSWCASSNFHRQAEMKIRSFLLPTLSTSSSTQVFPQRPWSQCIVL